MTIPLQPRVNLIYARAANGVIGLNNAMPWHLPEDLAHFKKLTLGSPVIMGRKTWDSLPAKFRPLPGRTNVVITRQPDWQAAGAQTAGCLPDALALCKGADDVWIIGGAQIYAMAKPLAHRVEVTEIAQEFSGDAYAPILGVEWVGSASEQHTSAGGLDYTFKTYLRTTAEADTL